MSSESTTEQPIRRKIGAKEFASTFGTNIAIQLCTIVQGVLLARLLGPTGRGQFVAATLWPTIFAGLGGLGLTVALARRSARSEDPSRIFRTGVVLSLVTGSVATLCCAIALPWLMATLDDVSRSTAWSFLPFIVLNHVTLALVATDHGAARFTAFNVTRLILNPVYLTLLVVLWLTHTTQVWWFVMSLLIANAVVAVLRVGFGVWQYSVFGPLEPVEEVAREALPFGAAGLISPLLQYADKALLLYMLGTTELGLYSVALAAASVANSLAVSASAITFGISAQPNDPNVFDRVARVFRVSAWIWLTLGTGLAFAIPFLFPLVYGSSFSAAIWPAIILIPAGACAGQASVLEESMRAQGRAFIGLEARGAGMTVFLIVGTLLARWLGLIGVTLAFNAAQFVTLVFMLCVARTHFARASFAEFVPRGADLVDLARRIPAQLKSIRSGA
ncbi:MAG TPA: oligosaccharide flippase family protein [Lacipirellulaceae bacterium]|jgi:O-antigen/teichoic acid export membrane protein|nr:oligosaccharide flippase family protein [Lacipirellulaceae bacterium]